MRHAYHMNVLRCAHSPAIIVLFFFFNDTATTEIYTLSLHDALPIFRRRHGDFLGGFRAAKIHPEGPDRKSTRLNSSHGYISYAVFCLKKNKHKIRQLHAVSDESARAQRATPPHSS